MDTWSSVIFMFPCNEWWDEHHPSCSLVHTWKYSVLLFPEGKASKASYYLCYCCAPMMHRECTGNFSGMRWGWGAVKQAGLRLFSQRPTSDYFSILDRKDEQCRNWQTMYSLMYILWCSTTLFLMKKLKIDSFYSHFV